MCVGIEERIGFLENVLEHGGYLIFQTLNHIHSILSLLFAALYLN